MRRTPYEMPDPPENEDEERQRYEDAVDQRDNDAVDRQRDRWVDQGGEG